MKQDYLNEIKQWIAYIEQNLRGTVTVDDVIHYSNYSYPQMHRVFYDIVGESIGGYIRKRRLAKAAEDLLQTNRPIVEIALNYDFSSQQTFTRAFTEQYGISPLRYRERGIREGIYPSFHMDEESMRSGPVEIQMEEVSSCMVASCQICQEYASVKKQQEVENRVIQKAWNQLIHWQMAYEYKLRFGVDAVLPSTTKLGKFMISNQLYLSPYTNYLGWIQPFPSKEGSFGYEACAKLSEVREDVIQALSSEDVNIKELKGGLYATAYATYGEHSNLDAVWKYMHYWLSENEQYTYGSHPWYEEHLTIPEEGGFHGFKVYLPIEAL